MLLRWLATAALLRPNSIGSLKSWSTCGEGRGSTGQASCALQCSGNEPVLDQFLRPWAHQEYLLPFHALDQYCDPATVRTLSAAVAVTNSSIFWKILDVVLALSQSRDTKPSVSRRDPKEHGACHWACSGNAMQMGRTEGVPRQSCNVPQQLRLQPGTGLLQP